ncbi:MAG: VWA domain-containing protein [Gammaproteobacteria bacterium]|nr:VWA domain-containing protein [Gammaproteobacteria bacterium]
MYFFKRFSCFSATTLLAFLSGYPHISLADDTDIYLGEEIQANVTRPNILFVLDQSGSMAWETGNSTSPEAGEPSRMDELKAALRAVLSTVDNVNVGVMTFTRTDATNAPVVYPITYVNASANSVEPSIPAISASIAALNDDASQMLNLLNPEVSVDSLTLSFGGAIMGTLGQLDSRLDWSVDDAEERISNGFMRVTDDTLEFPTDGSSNQLVGLRFRNVDIPSNSTVTDARISFRSDGSDYGSANVTIDVEKKLDPSPFSTSSYDISSRVLSGTPVDWLDVPNMVNRERYETPNLANLFNTQLLPPDVGWDWDASSKDVVFVMSGDTNRRRIESFDQNDRYNQRNNRAFLTVSYIEGSTTPERMTVGMRFTDLNIPQGARILGARLQVGAAENSNDIMDVSIYGEDVDDATAFEEVNSNISSRPKTTAHAGWHLDASAEDEWIQGNQYEYAENELIDVIQEIVDRGGWCGGNSLSLIVEANLDSNREIYSHEGNISLSPKLLIDFENDVPLDNPRTGAVNTGCTRAFFSAQIMRSTNDAEEASNGANYVDNAVVKMGTNTLALRFEGINLPQGSEIEQARITLRAESDYTTGSSTHTITGELSTNANPFGQTQNDIRDRAKTSAAINWTIPDTIGDNAYFDTADVSPVVQEIVNQATWQKDSPLALFISSSTKNRDIRSFDDAASNSARLTVHARYFRAGVTGLPPVYTARDRILQTIDAIEPVSSTPLVDAYYEAARYFRGEGIEYGDRRGNNQNTRVSHPASYTDGTPDPEGCTGVSSIACRNEVIDGSPVYISPITDPCAKNHIVLLTDGQTNQLSSTSLIRSMVGISSCANTPNNSDEACGRELSKFLSEEDQSSLVEKQKIITHTVAFALDAEDAIEFLQDLATKINDELDEDDQPKSDTAGLAVQATNASQLIDAFTAIFRTVSDDTASFAAPALSINTFNRFYNGNDIYLALFTPSIRPVWNGNIKNFKICSDSSECTLGEIMYQDGNGDLQEATEFLTNEDKRVIKNEAISNWNSVTDGPIVTKGGAGVKIPAPDSRRVYTYTGAEDMPSSYVPLNTDEHIVQNDNDPDSEAILGVAGETERDKLIQWIRGEDVDDVFDDSDVHWRIADPLHSSPLAINYGIAGENPITKLIVGTNEGGIRMINAYNGIEEWIFIPKELMDDQQEVRINAGNARFYGVDGVPSAWVYDKNKDGTVDPTAGDFVHMYIGMRRGGSNYYALDITPNGAAISDAASTTSITPKFMWTISNDDSDFKRLGNTWSRPVRARILMQEGGNTVGKNVLVFGGGYDEVLDNEFALNLPGTIGNAIYIIDASTGERIWSASSSTDMGDSVLIVPDMKYAIPSDVVIFDSNGDGYSDRIYVADMGGQLWRVDLASDLSTGNNGSTKIGKLAELSSTASLADNRRFFYPPDVVEVIDHNYSDIPRYNLIMLVSGERARPLSKSVQDRVYAIRDANIASIPDTGYTIDTGSDLYDVTSNLVQQGSDEQKAAEIEALKTSGGWFINLEEPGEKGIAKGIVLDNKFFFTTFRPENSGSASVCKLNNEGAGRLYAVNILQGSAALNWDDVDSPLDNPTKENRYMELGGGIPSEVVPVYQEEGITLITGLTSADTGIGIPRYRSYWSETDEPVTAP